MSQRMRLKIHVASYSVSRYTLVYKGYRALRVVVRTKADGFRCIALLRLSGFAYLGYRHQGFEFRVSGLGLSFWFEAGV